MNKNDPIFKSVFADKWEILPEVIKKHYANKPYSNDIVTVKGKMNFVIAPWARWAMPLFKCLKIIVPYAGSPIHYLGFITNITVSLQSLR